MATYTLAKNPEIVVSVRGKDLPITRQKALDKIFEMVESGKLLIELPKELSIEQLVLTEAQTQINDVESDEEQPLEMAVRELQKFLFLKLRTQRLKQGAAMARQNIAALLSEEILEQDLNQVEETLKGHFKTLKEFAAVLREYRQKKPIAESALIVLDEVLGFNLLTPTALTSTDEIETTETKTEPTNETAKNGNKRRAQSSGDLV